LLDRARSRRRWENQIADEITIKDIDREEVSRIIEAARSTERLVGPVGRSLPDLLDRLGIRRKGRLLRAAVVFFGKTFMPDYPAYGVCHDAEKPRAYRSFNPTASR